MGLFQILAALITLAAIFSYVNYRLLRLPQTVGLMAMALATSLIVLGLGKVFRGLPEGAALLLNSIYFNRALLHGMLGFLLFAGALQLDLSELRRHRLVIVTLSTVGLVISTAVVAGAMWVALDRLG